jgi:hypothetical protein
MNGEGWILLGNDRILSFSTGKRIRDVVIRSYVRSIETSFFENVEGAEGAVFTGQGQYCGSCRALGFWFWNEVESRLGRKPRVQGNKERREMRSARQVQRRRSTGKSMSRIDSWKGNETDRKEFLEEERRQRKRG